MILLTEEMIPEFKSYMEIFYEAHFEDSNNDNEYCRTVFGAGKFLMLRKKESGYVELFLSDIRLKTEIIEGFTNYYYTKYPPEQGDIDEQRAE